MNTPYFVLPDGTEVKELRVGGAGVQPTVSAHDALFGFLVGCDLEKAQQHLQNSSEEYDKGCDIVHKLIELRRDTATVDSDAEPTAEGAA